MGLHSKVEEESPRGRMFEGSAAKGSKKPDEFKEAITDLAKIMTDHVMQKGHKTPPLRNSPMKQVDTSPNVSMPLKAAEVKSIYIQQVKDLHGLDEVGATYQSVFFMQFNNVHSMHACSIPAVFLCVSELAALNV